MTTVINLNVFNLFSEYFRPWHDRESPGNAKSGSGNFSRAQDRVIDVTAFSEVVEDDYSHTSSGQADYRRMSPLPEKTDRIKAYDRNGIIYYSSFEKGVYVDLFS